MSIPKTFQPVQAPRFGAVFLRDISKPADKNKTFTMALTEGDARAPETQCLRADAEGSAQPDEFTFRFELNQCYDGQYRPSGSSWYPEIRFFAPTTSSETPSETYLYADLPKKLQILKKLLVRAVPVAAMELTYPNILWGQVNGFLDYRVCQAKKAVEASRQAVEGIRTQLSEAERGHQSNTETLAALEQASNLT